MNAVSLSSLTHRYGDRVALDSVDLDVREGEIFGLLGPNGGGKTTLFRILSTVLRPSSGTARVFDIDTVADPDGVRRAIGVVFQSPSLDQKLSAMENLRHQGVLYGLHGQELKRRSKEMLDRVGVGDRADELTEGFSGGMRRRVELAKGMLHDPKLLLLDEPSTGLDPGARRDVWTYLQEVRENDGVTSFLTTHLMEEAEKCDRLALLDEGKLLAVGTPDELKARIGGDIITVEAHDPDAFAAAVKEKFDLDSIVVDGMVHFEKADAHRFVPQLVDAFPDRIESVSLGKPTLEDVFVQLTGHRFWTEERGETQ
ncbi:MAG: ATP-binding cassette domain-containing protein [Planctomycetota bacterium]